MCIYEIWIEKCEPCELWTMWMMWTLWHYYRCMSSQVESIITFATIKRFNKEKMGIWHTQRFNIHNAHAHTQYGILAYPISILLILFFAPVHFLLNSPFVRMIPWIGFIVVFFVLFFFHLLERLYVDDWNAKRIRHHFKQWNEVKEKREIFQQTNPSKQW